MYNNINLDKIPVFNRLLFFKLQLNYYRINIKQKKPTWWSLKNQIEFTTRLSWLSNESIFKSDVDALFYTRLLDYNKYFWKIQRFFWFIRYCRFNKTFKKKILIISDQDRFAPLAVYFAKRYNQQYVLGWTSGLSTNRFITRFSYIKQFNLGYLFNYSKCTEFTIFTENRSHNLIKAFRELTNGLYTYPFVLFSAEDIFFSPASSFYTTKTQVLVYYYLSFFFSCAFHEISIFSGLSNR